MSVTRSVLRAIDEFALKLANDTGFIGTIEMRVPERLYMAAHGELAELMILGASGGQGQLGEPITYRTVSGDVKLMPDAEFAAKLAGVRRRAREAHAR